MLKRYPATVFIFIFSLPQQFLPFQWWRPARSVLGYHRWAFNLTYRLGLFSLRKRCVNLYRSLNRESNQPPGFPTISGSAPVICPQSSSGPFNTTALHSFPSSGRLFLAEVAWPKFGGSVIRFKRQPAPPPRCFIFRLIGSCSLRQLSSISRRGFVDGISLQH